MKQILQIIGLSIIVIGLSLVMFGLIVFGNNLPSGRTYDCSIAEFHPDYPLQVKEECRKLRSAKFV
jgi:hypothetical protein